MPVIKREGHVWKDGRTGDSCIHCGRRIEHFNDCIKHLGEWKEEVPISLLSTVICDSIIANPPKESDHIEPIGWGTYWRRKFYRKEKIDEIPERSYWTTGSGKKYYPYEMENLMEMKV